MEKGDFMLQNILENILVTVIIGAASAFAKWLYRALKASQKAPNNRSPRYSKRLLHKQFYIFLFTLTLSLIVGFSVPAPGPFTIGGIIRVSCFVVAGFSFIFVMGAFDATLARYPEDQPGNDKPSKEKSSNS